MTGTSQEGPANAGENMLAQRMVTGATCKPLPSLDSRLQPFPAHPLHTPPLTPPTAPLLKKSGIIASKHPAPAPSRGPACHQAPHHRAGIAPAVHTAQQAGEVGLVPRPTGEWREPAWLHVSASGRAAAAGACGEAGRIGGPAQCTRGRASHTLLPSGASRSRLSARSSGTSAAIE